MRGGTVTIEDLGSLNGTFLNKKRIEGEVEVHSGDNIEVGPVTFFVELLEEEPVMVTPEETDEEAPVVLEEIDVDLVEEEPVPPRSESATRKGKLLADKAKRMEGKPARLAGPNEATLEEDVELVAEEEPEKPPPEQEETEPIRLAGAKPRPPAQPRPPTPPAAPRKPAAPYRIEDDDMIPQAGERPREEKEAIYVDFDQAWKVPEANELRDILHGLEHGEAVEDGEEPK